MYKSIIQTCINEELFNSDGEYFWSDSLCRRKTKLLELKEKRSLAGLKGMENRWGKAKTDNEDNIVITKNNKGNERKGNNNKEIYKESVNNLFNLFWERYPKKLAKRDAEKAFAKINPDEKLFNLILEKLELYKQSEAWLKDGGQFIPYPATWLNGRRWEDEITPAIQGKKARYVN